MKEKVKKKKEEERATLSWKTNKQK